MRERRTADWRVDLSLDAAYPPGETHPPEDTHLIDGGPLTDDGGGF